MFEELKIYQKKARLIWTSILILWITVATLIFNVFFEDVNLRSYVAEQNFWMNDRHIIARNVEGKLLSFSHLSFDDFKKRFEKDKAKIYISEMGRFYYVIENNEGVFVTSNNYSRGKSDGHRTSVISVSGSVLKFYVYGSFLVPIIKTLALSFLCLIFLKQICKFTRQKVYNKIVRDGRDVDHL